MATKTVDFQTITIDELRDLLHENVEVILVEGSITVGRLVPTPAPLEHVSVYDLLAMPADQRQQAIAAALARAAHEDFELFEANEFLEDDEESA